MRLPRWPQVGNRPACQAARRPRELGYSPLDVLTAAAGTGRREIRLPYTYLGADDRAGPGYTGQPAVRSHYAEQH